MKFFNQRTFIRLAAGGLLATCVWLTGCETLDEEGPRNTLQISPSHATLGKNRSVTLSASGGANYRWAVEDPAIGSLSSTTGRSVVYTALQTGQNELIQTVILSGTTDLQPGGVGEEGVATATIIHREDHIETGKLTVGNVQNVTVGGAPVKLTASGGDGKNYVWSLRRGDIGELSRNAGREVAYQALKTHNTSQTVVVSSGGQTYQFVIIHNPGP